MDAWLQRLSALAQVGLALFTIGTIYTTVIPLYQKAVLDEAIAKKEIELKASTEALEKRYIQIRHLAVRDYIRFSVPTCTGVLQKIPNNVDEPIPPDDTLTLDIKRCIMNGEQTARSLNELRKVDRTFFREQLALVGERLTERQLEARKSVANAHLEVNDDNIEELAAKRIFENRLNHVLAKTMTPQQFSENKRRAAIAELKQERTSLYRDQVSVEMLKLLKLSWPQSKS